MSKDGQIVRTRRINICRNQRTRGACEYAKHGTYWTLRALSVFVAKDPGEHHKKSCFSGQRQVVELAVAAGIFEGSDRIHISVVSVVS